MDETNAVEERRQKTISEKLSRDMLAVGKTEMKCQGAQLKRELRLQEISAKAAEKRKHAALRAQERRREVMLNSR